MDIKVEVKDEVLGDRIFWEVDSQNINEIWNIPARNLAEEVIRDGKTRKSGMWVVSVG